jgi:hypothetical protein
LSFDNSAVRKSELDREALMREYRLLFEAVSPLSVEELSKDFYERFDGVLAERAGQVFLTVYVEGITALSAAHTAIEQLEKLPVSIRHADHDLVDASEIATRLEVSRQAVQLWATGKRNQSFPSPMGSPGGKRMWAWGEIVDWARTYQHNPAEEPPGLTRDELTLVNAHLVQRRRRVTNSPVVWAVKAGHLKAQAGVPGVDDYRQSSVDIKASLCL